MEILENVKYKLEGSLALKLKESLKMNPDIKKFTSKTNDYDYKLKTKFAPLVSVEVEMSFSQ